MSYCLIFISIREKQRRVISRECTKRTWHELRVSTALIQPLKCLDDFALWDGRRSLCSQLSELLPYGIFRWIFSLINLHYPALRPTCFVMKACDMHWRSLSSVVSRLKPDIGSLVGTQQKRVIAEKLRRRYSAGVGVITSSRLILAQFNFN